MNTNSKRILLIEDKEPERRSLAEFLYAEQYDFDTAVNSEDSLAFLDQPVGLVISGLKMDKFSGIDLLKRWKAARPDVPFVIVASQPDIDAAVDAMKLGADDFLQRPVDPAALNAVIRRCFEQGSEEVAEADMDAPSENPVGFEKIVGRSPIMLEIFENARRAAATESTILITGESGTGKELIAEAIHRNSPRKDFPFVTVNMAAVPEHLVESELFGHVKGAFTGATKSRNGRFETAHQGTIFIDEIGDFRLESQAKLLRVLENHVVTPIGSNHDRQVDVRVVAATSRILEDLVRDEQFREDLYYRLNVINLHLPPLRERREDIPLLIEHFVQELAESINKPIHALDQNLQDFLVNHDWPGNVRQLRNCLESMIVLAGHEKLTMDDLPALIDHDFSPTDDVNIPPDTTLEDLERKAVEQALKHHDGNRTHTAESLGISVRTLQRKLKIWGLDENSAST